MPYITANSVGVREYLNQDSAIFLTDPSTESLVKAINYLSNQNILQAYSKKINLNHSKIASQKLLSEKFDLILLDFYKAKLHRFV
jgi:hypothetical protein